jgi:2-amino-4-hydroxy-6-hydroxymethyldihydropteridine diphosphokinase
MLGRHLTIEEVAQTWETPAVGSRGPNFLNTAAAVRTQLPPELLKSLVLRRIERQLGRVRTANKNAPRTIDLDILVYEGQVLDPKVWTMLLWRSRWQSCCPTFAIRRRGDPGTGGQTAGRGRSPDIQAGYPYRKNKFWSGRLRAQTFFRIGAVLSRARYYPGTPGGWPGCCGKRRAWRRWSCGRRAF